MKFVRTLCAAMMLVPTLGAAVHPALGQGSPGVEGKVKVSGTEAPVARALVHFTRKGSDKPITVRTDKGGDFVVATLFPGVYRVSAECEGFRPTTLDDVEVTGANRIHLVIPLVRAT
jgi:hypothetical protein